MIGRCGDSAGEGGDGSDAGEAGVEEGGVLRVVEDEVAQEEDVEGFAWGKDVEEFCGGGTPGEALNDDYKLDSEAKEFRKGRKGAHDCRRRRDAVVACETANVDVGVRLDRADEIWIWEVGDDDLVSP